MAMKFEPVVAIMVSELASKADILAAQCEIDRMLTHGIGQITPALTRDFPWSGG